MKLQFPVDNEQIFLPNNIEQKFGMYEDNINNEREDWEEDWDSDDDSQEQGKENIIDITYTSIPYNAAFLANYFIRKVIKPSNVVDLAEAFFDLIKRRAELHDGPILVRDPAEHIYNFLCWYEFDADNLVNEVHCKRIWKADETGDIMDLSDSKLTVDIGEVLRPKAIYYANYDEYHVATFSVIYTLYDYLRNHKYRTVDTGRYKIGFTVEERNTIVAKRPIEM